MLIATNYKRILLISALAVSFNMLKERLIVTWIAVQLLALHSL